MKRSSAINPYVFVVGCPRSGTTLLQRMLDSHPQLAVANDTHFITRAVKKTLRKAVNPNLTSELLAQVRNYRRFYRMGLEDNEVDLAAADCSTYREFVSKLYTIRALKLGKPLSGEKTPDYCRQMPVLTELFPWARFIHIIRDGRNTALSVLNWASQSKGPGRLSLWKVDPVGCCALWWRWQTATGRHDGRLLNQGIYREVKYENLVKSPDEELASLTAFLQISYSEKMARYFEGKTINKPGLSAKSAWLPPTSGLRDWKSQMSLEDTVVFEGLAGDLLEQAGYEMSGLQPTSDTIKRIEKCRQWWRKSGKFCPGELFHMTL